MSIIYLHLYRKYLKASFIEWLIMIVVDWIRFHWICVHEWKTVTYVPYHRKLLFNDTSQCGIDILNLKTVWFICHFLQISLVRWNNSTLKNICLHIRQTDVLSSLSCNLRTLSQSTNVSHLLVFHSRFCFISKYTHAYSPPKCFSMRNNLLHVKGTHYVFSFCKSLRIHPMRCGCFNTDGKFSQSMRMCACGKRRSQKPRVEHSLTLSDSCPEFIANTFVIKFFATK